MAKILLHSEILNDIKLCRKKKWYVGLGKEMPRVCRLLMQDGKMPGERPVHYIKLPFLQNKVFHARIILPKENVSKRKGARIIYAKETFNLFKIIYAGGHKDKRYNNSFLQVKLIKERCLNESYIEYVEGFSFDIS